MLLGLKEPLKNSGSHIDASHLRQPLVKGERLVRYEVNAVMCILDHATAVCVRRRIHVLVIMLASCYPQGYAAPGFVQCQCNI